STPLLSSVSHTPSSPNTWRARVAGSTPASTARAGNDASTAKQISPWWRRSAVAIARVISSRHSAGNNLRAEGANRCLSRRIRSSPAAGGAAAPTEATTATPAAPTEAAAPTEPASTPATAAEWRSAPTAAAPAAVVRVAPRPREAGQPGEQADESAQGTDHQHARKQLRGRARHARTDH